MRIFQIFIKSLILSLFALIVTGIFVRASAAGQALPRGSVIRHEDFCVRHDGSFIYTVQGVPGSRIYLYSESKRSNTFVYSCDETLSNPSVSPDDKTIICAYRSSVSAASGLRLIDICSGHYKNITRNSIGVDSFPEFSPSGTRIVFCRSIRLSLTSTAPTDLMEVNLVSKRISRIMPSHLYALWSPQYIDENRIVFSGNLPSGSMGESRRVISTYHRGSPLDVVELPNETFIEIIGQNPVQHTLYAIASREQGQNNRIAVISLSDIGVPARWHFSSMNTDNAKFDAASNEIIFIAEKSSAYTICGYSLTDKKIRYHAVFYK